MKKVKKIPEGFFTKNLQDLIWKTFLMIVTALTFSVFPKNICHYWRLSPNADSHLENELRCIKYCSGVCEQNSIVISVREVNDWPAQ